MNRCLIALPFGALLAAASLALQPGKSQPEQPRTPADDAAQMFEMNRTNPGHEVLMSMVGTFDLAMTMHGPAQGMVFKCVATREMILGDKFLQERVEVKDGPMPFTSMSIVGFNPDAEGGGRFEVTRMSSMVTCQMPETGQFNAETKTFTLKGSHQVNGMHGHIRVEHTIGDGTERGEIYLSFEGYSDQFKGVNVPEYHAMTMEYTRRP